MASSSRSAVLALLGGSGSLRPARVLAVCQKCRRAISTSPTSWRSTSRPTSELEDQAPGLRVQSYRIDRKARKAGESSDKQGLVENVYLRGRSKALEQYAHLDPSPHPATSGPSRLRQGSADSVRSGPRDRREGRRPAGDLARLSEALEVIRGSADPSRPPRVAPRAAGHFDYRENLREWTTRPAKTPAQSKDVGQWRPDKKLSIPTMNAMRALHQADPERYTRQVLSSKFKVSYEATRRILRSKFYMIEKPLLDEVVQPVHVEEQEDALPPRNRKPRWTRERRESDRRVKTPGSRGGIETAQDGDVE